MPRTWEETVVDYPPYSDKQFYRAVITQVSKQRTPQVIVLTMELLDEEQAGRQLVQRLPLPIRPTGLAASCLKACRMEPQVGKRITPKRMEGCLVKIRVARTHDNTWSVTSFQSEEKESTHESNA